MAKNWFATLFRRTSRSAKRDGQRPRRRWLPCLPLIERLESRLAPATGIWTGASPTSQNWTDPNNWGGTAPNANDDLVFPATLAAGASFLTNNDFVDGTVFHSL